MATTHTDLLLTRCSRTPSSIIITDGMRVLRRWQLCRPADYWDIRCEARAIAERECRGLIVELD